MALAIDDGKMPVQDSGEAKHVRREQIDEAVLSVRGGSPVHGPDGDSPVGNEAVDVDEGKPVHVPVDEGSPVCAPVGEGAIASSGPPKSSLFDIPIDESVMKFVPSSKSVLSSQSYNKDSQQSSRDPRRVPRTGTIRMKNTKTPSIRKSVMRKLNADQEDI